MLHCTVSPCISVGLRHGAGSTPPAAWRCAVCNMTVHHLGNQVQCVTAAALRAWLLTYHTRKTDCVLSTHSDSSFRGSANLQAQFRTSWLR